MKPLDPKRFELIVTQLALHQAKSKVKAQILANGEKVCHFACTELTAKRDQYFAANKETLLAQALVDVWKLPSFARYRNQTTQ